MKTRQIRRSVRCNPLDYDHAKGVELSPSERFRTESFLSVIDQFIVSLDNRPQAYENISRRFSFFSNLKELSSHEIRVAAQELIKAYPDHLDISFTGEMCQFVTFANIFADEEQEGISIEIFFCTD